MKTPNQIKAAFDKLVWAFDAENVNWPERLLEQCKIEEKGHRGFMSDFNRYHPGAPSIADMARLFAVRRVAEYYLGEIPFPVGQQFLHTQTSCFYAAGIVDEYRDKIADAWSDEVIKELAELDYRHYVRVQTPAAA